MSLSPLSDMLKIKRAQQKSAFDEVSGVLEQFKKIASEVIPASLQGLYEIGYISEGILYLHIEHASHAQELTFYKHILLRKMAMTQKKIALSDIRIVQKRKSA